MAKNKKPVIKLKPTKPSTEVAVENNQTELESIDDILKNKLSDGVNSYRDLLTDTTVSGNWLNQRQPKLVKLERQVIPADPDNKADVEAAEFIKDQLERVKFDKILKAMHWGVFYGYAVGEIMWGIEDGKVVLDNVLVRDRGQFKFDIERQLIFIGNDSEVVMPDNKFWTFSMDCDTTDNPYGLGLAHFLFWPVLFKKSNVKFWLLGNEKQATGVPHVQYDPRATDVEAERRKALQAGIAIKNGSAVATAQGTLVEILKGMSGTSDYETLCRYMDEAISLVVLGQIMTSHGTGGQYKGDIQNEVLDDIIKCDADLICNSLNDTVVKWLCEWNFPNATPPKVWLLTEDQADELKTTEAWENMVAVGYRPTLDTVQETFGGEWEAIEQPAEAEKPPKQVTNPQDKAQKSPSNEDEKKEIDKEIDKEPDSEDDEKPEQPSKDFAEACPCGCADKTHDFAESVSQLDNLLNFSDNELNGLIAKEAETLLQLNATNKDDIAKQLLEKYDNLDFAELEQFLSKLLFIAAIMGNVDDE